MHDASWGATAENSDLPPHGQGATMSPETRTALATGKRLTKTQYREFVDHEAQRAGLKGFDDAVARVRHDVPPANYREMRVRMLLAQL